MRRCPRDFAWTWTDERRLLASMPPQVREAYVETVYRRAVGFRGELVTARWITKFRQCVEQARREPACR